MKLFFKIFKFSILFLSAFSLLSSTAPVNAQNAPTCPSGYTYDASKSTCVQPVAATATTGCANGITPTSRGTCYLQSIQSGTTSCPFGGNLVAFSSTGASGFAVDVPSRDGLVCYINSSTPPASNPPFAHNGCNPVTSYCAAAFGAYGNDDKGVYSYNVMYNPDGFRCPTGMKYLISSKWCATEASTTYTCPQGTVTGARVSVCLRTASPTGSSSSSSRTSSITSSNPSSQPANNISFQFATRKGKEGLSNWLSPTNNWAQYNCSSSSTIDGVSVSNLTQYCSQASNYAQSLNQSVVYGFKGLYSYNNGSCVEFTAFAFKINGNWQWRTFEGGNNQGTVVNSWKTTSDSGCPR